MNGILTPEKRTAIIKTNENRPTYSDEARPLADLAIKQAVPDVQASENFHSQSCDISDDWIYVAIVPHKLRLCKAFRIAQSGKPFHFVP